MSVFGHGQLRLYLLALLREGPRHGYDIIRALEERFSGLYTPSAGTVYPRLAKLEEEGLVERTDEGRKAFYRLTEAGRLEADARQEEITELENSLDASAHRLAEEMRNRVRSGAADLRTQVAQATAHLRSDNPAADTWREATDGPRGGTTGPASPPPFDLDGLLGGLTRGHLPDADAISRAVRRWGFGSPGQEPAGSPPTDSTAPPPGESAWPPPADSAEAVPTAGVVGADGLSGEVVDGLGPDAPKGRRDGDDAVRDERQEDRHEDRQREATGFPSAAQVREIMGILKDAGERIQQVLESPQR